MNKKEFEDFFKDLDPNEVPGVETDDNEDDDFSFASFFEDATTKPKKTQEEVIKVKSEPVFEDDIFAPPPPEADEEPHAIIKQPVEEPKFEKIEKKKPAVKNEDDLRKKKARKRYNTAYNWLVTVIWVAGVLAVSVFIATFALSSINDLVGFSKESREVEITIPEGYGLSEIAELLEENGIIDEPFTFEVYARVKDMHNKLSAGTFTLNANFGYDQIFQALTLPA